MSAEQRYAQQSIVYNMGSANLLGACPTLSGLADLTLQDKPMWAGVALLAGPLEEIGRRFD